MAYPADNFEKVLAHEHFDKSKPTAIYAYGFTQTISQPSVRDVVDAYLKNKNFNFLIINLDQIFDYTLFVRLIKFIINVELKLN
jgi:hypothetical protein